MDRLVEGFDRLIEKGIIPVRRFKRKCASGLVEHHPRKSAVPKPAMME
jgi:hypothetical protein